MAATATTGSVSQWDGMTAGAVVSRMVEVLASIPPEPISAWMREQGCDPVTGWVLLLPDSMAEQLKPYVPDCVRLSPLVPKPMIVFAPGLGL